MEKRFLLHGVVKDVTLWQSLFKISHTRFGHFLAGYHIEVSELLHLRQFLESRVGDIGETQG